MLELQINFIEDMREWKLKNISKGDCFLRKETLPKGWTHFVGASTLESCYSSLWKNWSDVFKTGCLSLEKPQYVLWMHISSKNKVKSKGNYTYLRLEELVPLNNEEAKIMGKILFGDSGDQIGIQRITSEPLPRFHNYLTQLEKNHPFDARLLAVHCYSDGYSHDLPTDHFTRQYEQKNIERHILLKKT